MKNATALSSLIGSTLRFGEDQVPAVVREDDITVVDDGVSGVRLMEPDDDETTPVNTRIVGALGGAIIANSDNDVVLPLIPASKKDAHIRAFALAYNA